MHSPGTITHAPNTVRLISRRGPPPSSARDQARGALLGLAAGNLLGLPVEGWSSDQIANRYPDGVTDIEPAERNLPMDDDLALTVELAEALLQQDQDLPDNFARRLIDWRHQNGRGIGITTSNVITLLERGYHHTQAPRMVYEDRGRIAPNGGIMRCAPVALFRRNQPQLLIAETAQTCAVTHHAPECQWSCILLNAAIAMLLRGQTPSIGDLADAAHLDGAPPEIAEKIRAVTQAPEPLHFDRGLIGHTLLCLQAAMWALTTPLTLESALVRLVRQGGDTDTNGAVAGTVLGARYGARTIPSRWRRCIPGQAHIQNLADSLSSPQS